MFFSSASTFHSLLSLSFTLVHFFPIFDSPLTIFIIMSASATLSSKLPPPSDGIIPALIKPCLALSVLRIQDVRGKVCVSVSVLYIHVFCHVLSFLGVRELEHELSQPDVDSFSLTLLIIRLRWSSWSRRPIEQLGRYSCSPATLSYEQSVSPCVHMCVCCACQHGPAPVFECWNILNCLKCLSSFCGFNIVHLWIFCFYIFEGSVREASSSWALREQEASQDHQ